MQTDKKYLFEQERPGKALAIMALPTIISQMIVLLYNLADTWYIGRTNDPDMVGASTLAVTLYLAVVALSNVFGVGGGTLMARLEGEKKTDEARKVASYSVAIAALSTLVFSLLILLFINPILRFLGADNATIVYARQYVLMTSVAGGVPTVLSICMPLLIRNVGYARQAGFGVSMGSLLNVALDPLFMFVILPHGKEVLGAGIATMLSNVISMIYFIVMFIKLKDTTVLSIPTRIEKIGTENIKALYSVGLPAALSIFLFDVVTIALNKMIVEYGNIPLAAMGIVLKVERLPMYIGIGIGLGMVPLVAYNYGAGNVERMKEISTVARRAVIISSIICTTLMVVFARPIMWEFIKNEATVGYGVTFLKARALAMPFMVIGNFIVHYMNAVGKGKVSLVLAVIRHLVLILPVMIVMNLILGLNGLVWSQLIADVINTVVSFMIFRHVEQTIMRERTSAI
jgi:Na+-driven multidrug efflux pump